MSKINEQIERLRELVRKCYGAVFAKGGEVPEVGERNMENLSSAIGSIKTIQTSGCVLEGSVPEEYIDILIGSKPIVEYDDTINSRFTGTYSGMQIMYIMPKAKKISMPYLMRANSSGGMFTTISGLEELNLPGLTELQYHTNFSNLKNLKYISLPSLTKIVGNSNFSGCTNLMECDLPKWGGGGYAAMFNGCTNLKRLKTGKITTGFGTNQWLHQSPDFIDLEIGEGTDVNLILSTMNPTNVLADAEKTAIFNANIRNHIAAKVIGQHTITFHANVKVALEQETVNAFTNKGWTIA